MKGFYQGAIHMLLAVCIAVIAVQNGVFSSKPDHVPASGNMVAYEAPTMPLPPIAPVNINEQ